MTDRSICHPSLSTKTRCLALAMIGTLVLSSTNCGGKSSGGPTPVATPTPPPQSIHTDLGGTNFNVRPGRSNSTNVDFPPVGMLDVAADWPGDDNIQVYATDQSCPGFDAVTSGGCAVLARADAPGPKPKRITFPTQTGKIYTIWVANAGTTTEPVNLAFGITTAGPTPQPSGAPTPAPSSGPGTPRASPTPSDLAAGPVAQVKAYIKTIDTGGFNYRPGEQDADGNWI